MDFFSSPFSRAYWQSASKDLKNTKMLVLAALLVAIRVAVKSVRIPIMEDLYIAIGFLPNALGSMLYGPYVAILTGVISDTLGALLFPVGAYFPPFMLVEISASLLFALFLYRAPLRLWRIAMSKFSVNLLCNIILTPLFLAWMSGKAAILTSLPRIVKNVLLFPLETLLLVVFLGAMLPILKNLDLTPKEQTTVKLSARHYMMLAALFMVSAVAVFAYVKFFMP